MAPNYYGCTATRHSEFTCMNYRTYNSKWTYPKWCDTCKALYPERETA